MKLTPRGLQVLPGAPAAPNIDEDTTALEMTCASSGCVIDFFTAREWLQTGFEKNSQKFELSRKAGKPAAERIPSLGRVDRLEESLYWMLAAVTLIYFLLGIIAG